MYTLTGDEGAMQNARSTKSQQKISQSTSRPAVWKWGVLSLFRRTPCSRQTRIVLHNTIFEHETLNDAAVRVISNTKNESTFRFMKSMQSDALKEKEMCVKTREKSMQ